VAGLRNTVLCMTFGAVVGALSVLAIGPLAPLGILAAPVAVGIGAAVLVLGAHLELLGTISASVYGFASVAGLILLKGVKPLDAVPADASRWSARTSLSRLARPAAWPFSRGREGPRLTPGPRAACSMA
jgi:Protein of unknown function (DUF1097)